MLKRQCSHRDGDARCEQPEGHDGPHLFKTSCSCGCWIQSNKSEPVIPIRYDRSKRNHDMK